MRTRRFVPLQELVDRFCLSLFLTTLALVVYRYDWRGKLISPLSTTRDFSPD